MENTVKRVSDFDILSTLFSLGYVSQSFVQASVPS